MIQTHQQLQSILPAMYTDPLQLTVELLQNQLRRVHVVAVAEVPSVFIGVCEEDHRFQNATFKDSR